MTDKDIIDTIIKNNPEKNIVDYISNHLHQAVVSVGNSETDDRISWGMFYAKTVELDTLLSALSRKMNHTKDEGVVL